MHISSRRGFLQTGITLASALVLRAQNNRVQTRGTVDFTLEARQDWIEVGGRYGLWDDVSIALLGVRHKSGGMHTQVTPASWPVGSFRNCEHYSQSKRTGPEAGVTWVCTR